MNRGNLNLAGCTFLSLTFFGTLTGTLLGASCGGLEETQPATLQQELIAPPSTTELVTLSAATKPTLDEVYRRFTTRKDVRDTIVLSKSGTYDFSGILHIWKGKAGGCAQLENGSQILRIEADNVVVKNFAFRGDGKDGSTTLGDPIHVTTCGTGQGNLCSRPGPKQVVLDGIIGHACEDLLTATSPGGDKVTIQNSILFANPQAKYRDKTIQFNFGKNFVVKNNTFVDGERCTRFKPNTSGLLEGNTFWDCAYPSRISSDDADISPMKNGPVTVRLKGNQFKGCKSAISKSGADAKIIDDGGNSFGCSRGF